MKPLPLSVQAIYLFRTRAWLYLGVTLLMDFLKFSLFLLAIRIFWLWLATHGTSLSVTGSWESMSWISKIESIISFLVRQWDAMTLGAQALAEAAFFFFAFTFEFMNVRGICRIASDQLTDQTVRFREASRDMFAFFPGALVYALVMEIALACALLLPIALGLRGVAAQVPALLAFALFSLTVPAAAAERLGVFAALRRGLALVGMVFGRAFALFVLDLLAFVFVSKTMDAAFYAASARSGSIDLVVAGVTFCCLLLVKIFVYIYLTLLFYRARDRVASLATAAA